MKKEFKSAKPPVDIETYNKIINRLVNVADKFLEIETVAKTITIWAKENDYELIPLIKILNNKIKAVADALNR